jgi:L-cysteate sulfo-lyase
VRLGLDVILVLAGRGSDGPTGDLAQIVVAVGSGGTMAGLVHALTARRVVGVHTGAVPDPHHRVQRLVDGLAARRDINIRETNGSESNGSESNGSESNGSESSSGETNGSDEPLRIRMDQVGAGYGHLSDSAGDALRIAARTEGLVLDPVYTGRALAGLAAAVADGTIRPGQRTVLLHCGGLPGLFGHPEAMALAAADLG